MRMTLLSTIWEEQKMSKKDDALEQLRQRKIAMPDVAPPVHDGLWDLPGFVEARESFHRRGLTGAWVDTVIDPSDKWACFERPGKSCYRSECPAFEGFWLDGGCGSVQCRNVPFLFPGLHWDNTCSKNPELCPFYKKEEDT